MNLSDEIKKRFVQFLSPEFHPALKKSAPELFPQGYTEKDSEFHWPQEGEKGTPSGDVEVMGKKEEVPLVEPLQVDPYQYNDNPENYPEGSDGYNRAMEAQKKPYTEVQDAGGVQIIPKKEIPLDHPEEFTHDHQRDEETKRKQRMKPKVI